jgi:RNA polymerase sigma-70 factor (ECF subfamily)
MSATSHVRAAAPAAGPDADVVAALRAGDEAAFVALVRGMHALLHRTAMTYVPSRAVADEVVQETWLAVVEGLDRFEGRSSLRTWIFRIAANIARSRGGREGRCRPFSSLGRSADRPAVDADRFGPAGHAAWPGHWASPPVTWETPEERLLARETQDVIRAAIDRLPASQRLVVTLRDVEGWDAAEACAALEISAANQRVLLHRARARVRDALEAHLGRAPSAA